MRKALLPVVLLALAPGAPGDEVRRDFPFFRTPDPESRREIQYLCSAKGVAIGSGTRDKRTEARRKLVDYGFWAAPFLADALRKGSSIRIRMNAALTAARILAPSSLEAIRRSIQEDPDEWVRTAAVLALALYRTGSHDDRNLFQVTMGEKRTKNLASRAAAIALAKQRGSRSAVILSVAASDPPRDEERLASAVLLAAAVATPESRRALVANLSAHDKIVRRAAATGLTIRPLPAGGVGPLLDRLEPTRETDHEIRAVLYRALASAERSDEIRARLLACVGRTREKGARIEAAIGLAREWNVADNLQALRRAYRSFRDRNDPVAAAIGFALVHTGAQEAVDELLQYVRYGSDFRRFYAIGNLLYLDAFGPNQIRNRSELYAAIEKVRSDDDGVRELLALARVLRLTLDAAERRRIALEGTDSGIDGFEEIRDRRGLHLWDWTWEERVWDGVNEMLPRIFGLDDIADRGEAGERDEESGGGPDPGARSGAGTARAAPEEQDLIDFLREEPFFVPEDLGRGR